MKDRTFYRMLKKFIWMLFSAKLQASFLMSEEIRSMQSKFSLDVSQTCKSHGHIHSESSAETSTDCTCQQCSEHLRSHSTASRIDRNQGLKLSTRLLQQKTVVRSTTVTILLITTVYKSQDSTVRLQQYITHYQLHYQHITILSSEFSLFCLSPI